MVGFRLERFKKDLAKKFSAIHSLCSVEKIVHLAGFEGKM